MTDPLDKLPDIVNIDMAEQVRNERGGRVSVFTCPECGGCLWQVNEAELLRFRCHVGHVYNGEAMFAEQSSALEAALWTSVRTFKERFLLARLLAAHEILRGNRAAAARFEEQAAQAERYGELIKRYVLNGAPLPAKEKGAATEPEESEPSS